jgi:hypothetical protein
MSNLSRKLMMGAAGAADEKVYVEDVFSTYLYTGNGSTQTITNDIDLAGEGGLVWVKKRDSNIADTGHILEDTERGANYYLSTNSTNAESYEPQNFSFNSDGFSMNVNNLTMNYASSIYASWTFRKAEKFFDVVTYTGDGAASRNIAHNLGSVPGCIIGRGVSISDNWGVYHRSTGANGLYLNGTNSAGVTGVLTGQTSTTFEVGNGYGINNSSGVTYVAYLFAHNAGGFGDAGTDSVIACGSYTGNGSADGPEIDLGWEPQWVMIKGASQSSNWAMLDTMRGFSKSTDQSLFANLINPEGPDEYAEPTATGFKLKQSIYFPNSSGETYIYIAIRRGPMRAPESGTEVFAPIAVTNSAGSNNTTNFPVDLQINSLRSAASKLAVDRLRGVSTTDTNIGSQLVTNNTNAEAGSGAGSITRNWSNTGFQTSDEYGSLSTIYWNFRRAPGFFDVVAYTGDGTTTTIPHNLQVVPELIINKVRNDGGTWRVHHVDFGYDYEIYLNGTTAMQGPGYGGNWGGANPTATHLAVSGATNTNTYNFISYLFATLAGISKVGIYTGTGTTLSIDCGFTAGARFILIKRTDSTGDWYVWDTARGIIAGNDPYLLLNSSNAEVTNTDYIDPLSSGFQISSTAPAAINASGGSYIFLAIA